MQFLESMRKETLLPLQYLPTLVYADQAADSALPSLQYLPTFLEYVRRYLLAFSPNDLDRASARQLLQMFSNDTSLALPQELQKLIQNWCTIGTFIDQPIISKKELVALASAISQLSPLTHTLFLEKLGPTFVSCIRSEADLMCVIYAMNTTLTEPELLRFFHLLAEVVGEEYKRKSVEAILVPYIRIVLQLEIIVRDISKAEQEQFTTQFLNTLLKYANRKTYTAITAFSRDWPDKVSTKWKAFISKQSHTLVLKKTSTKTFKHSDDNASAYSSGKIALFVTLALLVIIGSTGLIYTTVKSYNDSVANATATAGSHVTATAGSRATATAGPYATATAAISVYNTATARGVMGGFGSQTLCISPF